MFFIGRSATVIEIYLVYGTYEYSYDECEYKHLYAGYRKEKALEILEDDHQKYGYSGWNYYIETWKDEELISNFSAKELFGDPPMEHINPQPTLEFWRNNRFAEIEKEMQEVCINHLQKHFSYLANLAEKKAIE